MFGEYKLSFTIPGFITQQDMGAGPMGKNCGHDAVHGQFLIWLNLTVQGNVFGMVDLHGHQVQREMIVLNVSIQMAGDGPSDSHGEDRMGDDSIRLGVVEITG